MGKRRLQTSFVTILGGDQAKGNGERGDLMDGVGVFREEDWSDYGENTEEASEGSFPVFEEVLFHVICVGCVLRKCSRGYLRVCRLQERLV